MGRPPRLQFEGAFYHVYARGNRREKTFLDSTDYHEFEDVLLDQASQCDLNLYSWCPMPNHFHVAVETPRANLASFMQRLLTEYARYFNLKYRKVGDVFQGRYGSKLIDREEYLLELIRYIHLNPYRVKNPHWKVPETGWPWSSHRFYVGGDEPAVAVPFIQSVLRRFGDEPAVARQRYAAFIADGLSQGTWEDFYQVKEGRFIGRDTWIADTKVRFGETRLDLPLPAWPGFSGLLKAIAQETNMSIERLVSGERSRDISRGRQLFACMAVRVWKRSQAATAQVLQKDPTAVSHWLRSAEWDRQNPIVQRIVARLMTSSKVSCE